MKNKTDETIKRIKENFQDVRKSIIENVESRNNPTISDLEGVFLTGEYAKHIDSQTKLITNLQTVITTITEHPFQLRNYCLLFDLEESDGSAVICSKLLCLLLELCDIAGYQTCVSVEVQLPPEEGFSVSNMQCKETNNKPEKHDE